MPKYLVLYLSAVPAREQMGSSDPQAAQAGLELWMNWFGRLGPAMADMGSPLEGVATVTAAGSTAEMAPPYVGGFSVLEADSPAEVTKLLEDHPHFHAPGDPSIEVMEFLPTPGM